MILEQLKMKESTDLKTYTKKEPRFEDGEWWYIRPNGKRERVESHARKNTTRMFVNGKYIPKSDPLHKPGNWKTWSHVHSFEKLDSEAKGEVYAVVNNAWPEWIKVGKAKDADDRCNGYQTSSPFRDYSVLARMATEDRNAMEKEMHRTFEHFAEDRRGEWFKIDKVTAIKIFNYKIQENEVEA